MKRSLTLLSALLLVPLATLHADDTAKLATILAPATVHGGTVTIPPGDYEMAGTVPMTLASYMTVLAYGARFHLPKMLGDKTRGVVFAGENMSDGRWFGGHFGGTVFDNTKADNSWEPNANARAILITTTPSRKGVRAKKVSAEQKRFRAHGPHLEGRPFLFLLSRRRIKDFSLSAAARDSS